MRGMSRTGWLVAAGLLGLLAAILIAMGRPPICPCGTISLWHGTVQSNQNSQQISDWYSFSHIIHGFIFYGLSRWLMPRAPLWTALAVAIGIEGAWEILETSPVIIDRYREVTMAYGYAGDSVLNSVSDAAFSHYPVDGQIELLLNLGDAELGKRVITPSSVRLQGMGGGDSLLAPFDGNVHQHTST